MSDLLRRPFVAQPESAASLWNSKGYANTSSELVSPASWNPREIPLCLAGQALSRIDTQSRLGLHHRVEAGAGTRIDGDPISSSSWDYAVNVHSVERRALRTPRNERRVTGVAPWRARCRVPRSSPRTDRSTAGAIRDRWCATALAVTPDGCPRSRSWTRSASSSPDRSWSATRSPPGAACGPGPPCVVVYILAGQAPPDATNCASIERSGVTGDQHGPRADCRSRRFGALA